MAKEFYVETYLFCENCLEETSHLAKYKDDEIIKLTCKDCHNEIMLKRENTYEAGIKSIFERFPLSLFSSSDSEKKEKSLKPERK